MQIICQRNQFLLIKNPDKIQNTDVDKMSENETNALIDKKLKQ
jgi:hypothetical protein